jgi:transcriptional regulator with XRE-family HTH domain
MKVKAKTTSILTQLMGNIDEKALNRTRTRMLVAAKISDAAQNKGINQKKLAALIDKSESEVSEWLSGERNMTIDVIADFEQALNITILNVQQPKVIKMKIVDDSVQVSLRNKSSLIGSNSIKFGQTLTLDNNSSTKLALAQ